MRLLLFLLGACQGPEPEVQAPVPSPRAPAVIFLSRHGEKTSSAADAGLTEEGTERAALLARMLTDVELVAVHSTDTVRTRATAQPTAEAHGLPVSLYDDGTSLVTQIDVQRGSHLVVGHSDTLPSLVRLLDPTAVVEPIGSSEYDRLYVITQTDAGASTTLLRYGPPEEEPAE